MKIYFTASIRGKESYGKEYEAIVGALKGMGYQVYSDQIIKNDTGRKNSETREETAAIYKKLTRMLKSSDLMIAEITAPSVSVGHEISLALEMGKPVIAMSLDSQVSNFLLGRPDEKLHCVSYEVKRVKVILRQQINEALGQRDMRFNFFVSPEIMSYLEDVTKEKRVPKSVYIRELIEADMKKKR